MNRLLEIIARKAELRTLLEDPKSDLDVIEKELRSLNDEQALIEKRNKLIQDAGESVDTIENNADGLEQRSQNQPLGAAKILSSYGIGVVAKDDTEARKTEMEKIEKRGQALLESRSVTITSNVLLAKYTSDTLNPAFNQVSGLVDKVTTKPLIGGESFSQGYVKGYGTADYTTEGSDYNSAEPTFGYAVINKTKITSYAEDTEELLKLSAANYDAEVIKGVRIASRKKISREILVGDGTTGHLVGIFSTNATAIDSSTDLAITAIDEDTLDNIIFGFGGDEDVEAASVLILNKKDLKAFSVLRDANGKKIYEIVTNGNSGTINTIPYIINSACYSIANGATTGQYCMAYGPLENYLLTVFSEMDVQRSTDYKFKQGMIANKSSIFVGGNVVSVNGFLRVKKG